MDPLLAIYLTAGAILALMATLAIALNDIGPDERGVVLRGGRAHRVLAPGRHFVLPFFDRVVRVDMRPFQETLELPVVTSRDGAWHQVALEASCRILQPEVAAASATPYREQTRTLLETALREAAGDMPGNELREERSRLGRSLKKLANEAALTWGVDIQSVELTALKPIATPGPGETARWSVQLEHAGPAKIQVLKVVRDAARAGLKEAKDLVESAPVDVVKGFELQAAEAIATRLRAAGARARVMRDADEPETTGVARAQKDHCHLVLESAGDNMIQVIKFVRDATGLSLKETKELVDSAPVTLPSELTRSDAEALRSVLEEAGAQVTLH